MPEHAIKRLLFCKGKTSRAAGNSNHTNTGFNDISFNKNLHRGQLHYVYLRGIYSKQNHVRLKILIHFTMLKENQTGVVETVARPNVIRNHIFLQ